MRAAAHFVFDAVLRAYAQVLFSRGPAVGLLLVGATLFAPARAAVGLLAVLVATATARLLGLSRDLTRDGLFGYNALLIGLAGAALYEPGATTTTLLLAAAATSVLVTAAVHSALGATFGLPALTVPFLLVTWGLTGAAPALGIAPRTAVFLAPLWSDGLPAVLDGYLQAMGAVFLDPRATTGLVVVAALLLHSRVAWLLSVVGYAAGLAVVAQLTDAATPTLSLLLGFNALLVAVALGGVWFVPSPAAFLLAAAGAALGALMALALRPLFVPAHLPLLVAPFNLTAFLFLYALRQRVRDARPKAVDFVPGTPEANLTWYRTRVARFGARYAVRFRPPFRGRWACTQGVDGSLTHVGPWRHALDFEVLDEGGRAFGGAGRRREDFHCYGLPVLAVADGTVAHVVDDVPDNAIGEVDLRRNWGNVVVLQHGPGLYSLVAHLTPGSVPVRAGQAVAAGDVVGRCGASGRAPRPHVHFQLQATARVGAPTLPIELHDVVDASDADAPALRGAWTPAQGDAVRAPEPDPELARAFAFGYGQAFRLQVDDGAPERVVPDIDLLGGLVLRSERGTALYYDHRPALFTAFDVVGPPSALHLMRLALGRVPFEPGLTWTDVIPRRVGLPGALRPLFDLAAPFLPSAGATLRCRLRRIDGGVEIEGEGPGMRTRARLGPGGPEIIEVELRGRRRVVRWLPDEAAGTEPERSPRWESKHA